MRKESAPSRSQGREEKMQAASFFAHCRSIVKALVPSIPQSAAWPWPAVLAVITDVAREVSA